MFRPAAARQRARGGNMHDDHDISRERPHLGDRDRIDETDSDQPAIIDADWREKTWQGD